MDKKKRTFYLFCALQFTYWGCFAAFNAYFVALMLDAGMTSTRISLIQATYLMAAFAGSFVWGGISDKLHTNRKTFLMQMAGSLVTGLIIYFFRHITLVVALVYPVFGFCLVPMASNLDSWIIKSFPEDPDYYGTTRGVSAFGYGFLALGFGQLVARVGYFIMPIGLIVFSVLSIVIAVIEPDSPMVGVKLTERFSVKDIGTLFKNGPYVILLVTLLLTGLSFVPLSYMKLLLYQNVGGDVTWVGYESFVGCLVQTPFFIAAGKLKKIPVATRMTLALSGMAMMLVFYFIANRPWMILFGSVFYFVGYSVLLPTYREKGSGLIEGRLMTTAQSLIDAVFGSLAGMSGLFYAGYVIDTLGPKMLVTFSIFTFIIPLVIVYVQLMKYLKKAKEAKHDAG